VSTRHLSFVENGKARPSRELLLALSAAMDLPLRERNDLLGAAGFAPAFRESALDQSAMAPIARAIDLMFAHAEPHPAILFDHRWNLLRANDDAVRFLLWLGASPEALTRKPVNGLRLLFDPEGPLRRHTRNFDALADALLARVEREAEVDCSDEALRALVSELRALRGPRATSSAAEASRSEPLVAMPLEVEKDGQRLRYFTTITTLGTPLDLTAQSLRIEMYVPLDDETTRFATALRG
jgi:hypothetical protein